MAFHQYNFPTRIQYGPGALALLPGALAEAGRRRPLIVTDKGLLPLRPITAAKKILDDAGLGTAVFGGVWGNPVKSQVTAGVEAFKAHGADAIVAIGGGAALDVGKAIAVMVHHPGDLFDYEDEKPGARPIDRELPTLFTVPTTAGTGSEVGRSTVISDDETRVKKIIFSPRLLAQRVFVDPDLTLGLPAGVTAATGMDALTHLIESYLARGFHPLCDGIALEGVRLVARSLTQCVSFARRIEGGERDLLASEEHREARGLMLMASLMGAVAFQKGLGVTHSLAHALSTVCDLHHGLANGVLLPYALAYNADVAGERMAHLAAIVRLEVPQAPDLVGWVTALKQELGIPRTLAEVGVKPEHLDRLTAIATADGCHQNNPKPVPAADFRPLFERALAWRP